jgi:hypothetical protein
LKARGRLGLGGSYIQIYQGCREKQAVLAQMTERTEEENRDTKGLRKPFLALSIDNRMDC